MKLILRFAVLIFVFSGIGSNAQEKKAKNLEVNPNQIYSTWFYSGKDKHSDNLIYMSETSSRKNINTKGVVWKFEQNTDVFFTAKTNAGLVYVPDPPKKYRTSPSGKYVFQPMRIEQGKWKMNFFDEELRLELKYFESLNGSRPKLKSIEVYQVIHLKSDVMILEKLEKTL